MTNLDELRTLLAGATRGPFEARATELVSRDPDEIRKQQYQHLVFARRLVNDRPDEYLGDEEELEIWNRYYGGAALIAESMDSANALALAAILNAMPGLLDELEMHRDACTDRAKDAEWDALEPITFLQTFDDGAKHRVWAIGRPRPIADMALELKRNGVELRLSILDGGVRKLTVQILSSSKVSSILPWPEASWKTDDQAGEMVDVFVEAAHRRLELEDSA